MRYGLHVISETTVFEEHGLFSKHVRGVVGGGLVDLDLAQVGLDGWDPHSEDLAAVQVDQHALLLVRHDRHEACGRGIMRKEGGEQEGLGCGGEGH